MAPPEVALLIVGDELLAGEVADANGPFLAAALATHGLRLRELRLVGDAEEAIRTAIRELLPGVTGLLVCGGLGPTSDDRTTAAVAAALERPLVLDPPTWQRIRDWSAARGLLPPPGNQKQARVPADATLLVNDWGMAPGYVCTLGPATGKQPSAVGADPPRWLAVLPGPPRECHPLFTHRLGPWLAARQGDRGPLPTVVLRTFGLPESLVGARLQELEAAHQAIAFGYQWRMPEVLVKLRGQADLAMQLAAAADAVEAALQPHVYGRGAADLPTVLGRQLAARQLRIVTAESCTGGLLAKLLTDTPGSSAWFERGFVTYSNQAKQEQLGVAAALLAKHGAVSEPVALAMVAGALARSPAEVGVAITGIAGPDGGLPGKPVGTVCLAWAQPGQPPAVRTFTFQGERDQIRLRAAWTACQLLLQSKATVNR